MEKSEGKYSMLSGYLPLAFHNQNKPLSISKSIFAWLILLTFGANLIYRMAHRTMIPPFTSFDTLLNETKYDVLVFKGSVIYEFVKVSVNFLSRDISNLSNTSR